MTRTYIVYFAYGSNMYTPRLRYRVSGVEVIGLAQLSGHRLRFHKRGKDTSGKCNAEFTNVAGDQVTGVLFRVPSEQIRDLHRAEGRGVGYDDINVRILDSQGQWLDALTYRAQGSYIDDNLCPFTWYWDFVVAGAREHALPREYVERCILAIEHHPDPDRCRDADERLKVLGQPANG